LKTITDPKLGLKEDAAHFWLLVLVNGFVEAMVDLERSVIPEFTKTNFGISGQPALLFFIVAFGLAKSLNSKFKLKIIN
jgi:hypothetical protein